MERKFWENFKLEKETVDAIMAENGKDIEKAKKLGAAAAERVTDLETQLAEVGEKLKAFDGVDVAGMKGQIGALTADMAAKDGEWQQKMADRDFNDLLHSEIVSAKGINTKAVAALLDVDTLKGSKNQKEDTAAAIVKLKESDPNQFETDKPTMTFTKSASSAAESIDPLEAIRQRTNKIYADAKKE